MIDCYLYKINNKITYSGKTISNDKYLVVYDSNQTFMDSDIPKFLEDKIIVDGLYTVIIYNKKTKEIIAYQDSYNYIHNLYYYQDGKDIYIDLSMKHLIENSPVIPTYNKTGAQIFAYIGFLYGKETLINEISKVDWFTKIIFKSGELNISKLEFNLPYTKRESYSDCLANNIPDGYENYYCTLSGGFDSTLILNTLVDMKKPIGGAITIGAHTGKSEIDVAKANCDIYGVKQLVGYTTEDTLENYPDIVYALEDNCYEHGIFLQYELAQILKTIPTKKDVVLFGDFADQLVAKNTKFTPITTVQEVVDYVKANQSPTSKREQTARMVPPEYDFAFRILNRKNGTFLRESGINFVYPFLSNDFKVYADQYRELNPRKAQYKEYVKSICPKEVANSLDKKGGSTSVNSVLPWDRFWEIQDIISASDLGEDCSNFYVDESRKYAVTNRLLKFLYLYLFKYIFITNGKEPYQSFKLSALIIKPPVEKEEKVD